MRWPKYWSFSFSIIPSKEHPGLISLRMDWLDLLAVQEILKSLLKHHSSKASILWRSAFFWRRQWHPTPVLLSGKSHGRRSLVGCSSWGREESDTAERIHFHFSLFTFMHWRRTWQPTRLPRPWDSPDKNSGVGCHFLLQCMKVESESEVAQSCLTLRDPMDCSPPGIFQARILEWGAIAFSTVSARLSDYYYYCY